MSGRRTPVFLPPASYRLRRRRDAALLLPLLGAFLFGLPVLWPSGAEGGPGTARLGLYLFAVWAGLIAAAGLLSSRLGDPGTGDPVERDGTDAAQGEER